MSRRDDNPLDEAEALLEWHGIPYRRLSFSRLQVEDLILDITGTLRIGGAGFMGSLPNAGVHGLLRLLQRREAFCRDYGVARPLSAGARERPPGRRALERRVAQLLGACQRAERERAEALAERDEAVAKLGRVKKRLRAKSAECDALLDELRER